MLRRMVGVMRGTANVSECMDNVSSKEGACFVEPTPLVVHAMGILIFERILRTPYTFPDTALRRPRPSVPRRSLPSPHSVHCILCSTSGILR